MNPSPDPLDYVEQVAWYRKRAVAVFDNPDLRDSYLALARSYERLANAWKMQASSGNTERVQD